MSSRRDYDRFKVPSRERQSSSSSTSSSSSVKHRDRSSRHSSSTSFPPSFSSSSSKSQNRQKEPDERNNNQPGGSRKESREYDVKTFDDDRRRSKDDSLTNVIMLRGLNPSTTIETITDHLKVFGPIEDVRLIRNKTTGESRGFAFVDFSTTEEAKNFMDYHLSENDGQIDIDGCTIQLDYSRQPPGTSRAVAPRTATEFKDWICNQCQGSNFARRTACYLCHTPKPPNPETCTVVVVEDKEVPCSVLVVRGLDCLTSEDSIHSTFSEFANVKEVRLIRDKQTQMSRGFCFVEFYSVEDATKGLKRSIGLRIDDHLIRVSYSRRSHLQDPTNQNFVNEAIEQAQWLAKQQTQNLAAQSFQYHNQWRMPSNDGKEKQESTIDAYGSTLLQANPFASNYTYDANSGFYYDSTTGMFYDPVNQYYFDSNTQQYCYFDADTNSYQPYSSHGVMPKQQPIVASKKLPVELTESKTPAESKPISVEVEPPPVANSTTATEATAKDPKKKKEQHTGPGKKTLHTKSNLRSKKVREFEGSLVRTRESLSCAWPGAPSFIHHSSCL
eukprot:TRINITY_DN4345_c0_g1_i1.p1 TRINITY_DN4345_c0_g1~~TRINITY_DN4345_c0_g1_i1.p1  ORF type:complete len:557 (-),score=98.62 TRINITY_DN4345_c0_g1_i1:1329-2999(-)